MDGQTSSRSHSCSPQQATSSDRTDRGPFRNSRALAASRAAADSSFRVTVRPASSASSLAARAACLSRRPPDDASCIVPSMLRAKRECSPKPMLLTVSLSGWHKDGCHTHSVCPPSRWSPKALEVSSFVGLLLCLVYVTTFRSLREKAGLESMGDRRLTRLKRPLSTASSIASPRAREPRRSFPGLPVPDETCGGVERARFPSRQAWHSPVYTRAVTRNDRF